MEILYLSHCAPDAPSKGEKIRAYHFLHHLVRNFDVHLVCFARDDAEAEGLRPLETLCASVTVERHPGSRALLSAAPRFLFGQSLTAAYYASASLKRRIASAPWLANVRATLAYSAVMADYAPASAPLVLDLCDLDSEKWADYARLRHPGPLYAIESRRLRRVEQQAAARAIRTLVMTENEATLAATALQGAQTEIVANGVDFDYWRPQETAAPETLCLAFVGQLDYYPNADAASWFARDILPALRAADSRIEFVIAGRSPSASVRALAALPGVSVVASPHDVRPILAGAAAVVTPIRLARGLQNKVLEALAMGKPVYASGEVGRTFGSALPQGVTVCPDAKSFISTLLAAPLQPGACDPAIRESLRTRYSWESSCRKLCGILEQAAMSR